MWIVAILAALAVLSLPILIGLARGLPFPTLALGAGLAIGLPVIGWFIAMWFALSSPPARS